MKAIPPSREIENEIRDALTTSFAFQRLFTGDSLPLAEVYRKIGRRVARTLGWKVRTFNLPAGDDTLAIVAVTEVDADTAQRFEDHNKARLREAVQATATNPDPDPGPPPRGHLRSVD